MVADGGIHVDNCLVAVRQTCQHQCLDIHHPQPGMIAGEVYPSVPRPTVAGVGQSRQPGLEDVGVGVVRAEQQPLLAARDVVVIGKWDFPAVD